MVKYDNARQLVDQAMELSSLQPDHECYRENLKTAVRHIISIESNNLQYITNPSFNQQPCFDYLSYTSKALLELLKKFHGDNLFEELYREVSNAMSHRDNNTQLLFQVPQFQWLQSSNNQIMSSSYQSLPRFGCN